MKDFISGLWNGPKTTFAAFVVATCTAILASQEAVGMPDWATLALAAIIGGLSIYQTPKK